MSQDYVIVTDSGADLPKELLARYSILSLPLELHFEDGETRYNDDVALSPFFARLRAKQTVRTSAVNMERFLHVFETVFKQGKDIFYIGFSSALSATYRAGELAAEELVTRYPQRKILTVDSLCASLGQGLLVILAAKKKEGGMKIEELYEYVKRERWHLCHEFTVDDLFFLKRGGRVSGATAVLGTLLSVKPIMHVDNEGRLVKIGTARGRRASLTALMERMKKNAVDRGEMPVYICHGDCYEDACALGEMIQRALRKIKEIHWLVSRFALHPKAPSDEGAGMV